MNEALEESQIYKRIEKAIVFIRDHSESRPGLDEIAQHVNLSTFYFQKLFTEWAGISPKEFLQNIHVKKAKFLLRQEQRSLFDTALETGLSGTGRLHDLFIKIESMSPAEYKNGAQGLDIFYSFRNTQFGEIVIASTKKGICHLMFTEQDHEAALQRLVSEFPNANIIHSAQDIHEEAGNFFFNKTKNRNLIKLHLKGSNFRIKVWESLLHIPEGKTSSYKQIAEETGNTKASRAVGSAVGSNPVAFLIPCHRVIQNNGNWGEYMWGADRKTGMLLWESVQKNKKHESV